MDWHSTCQNLLCERKAEGKDSSSSSSSSSDKKKKKDKKKEKKQKKKANCLIALCWLATGRTCATFLGIVRSCAAGKKGQKEGEEAPEKSSKGSQEGQTWTDWVLGRWYFSGPNITLLLVCTGSTWRLSDIPLAKYSASMPERNAMQGCHASGAILWLLAQTGVRVDFWFIECFQFSFYWQTGRAFLIDFLIDLQYRDQANKLTVLRQHSHDYPDPCSPQFQFGEQLQHRKPAIYRLLLMWQADWQQAAIAVFCCFITFILFLIKDHCLKTLNSAQVGEVLADAAEKSWRTGEGRQRTSGGQDKAKASTRKGGN